VESPVSCTELAPSIIESPHRSVVESDISLGSWDAPAWEIWERSQYYIKLVYYYDWMHGPKIMLSLMGSLGVTGSL
jgi:hypothetical protein